MENITTGKLIDEIARKTGLTKKEVHGALDALSETIVDTLSRGGRVEIRNLASFTVDEAAPRLARHPRTGKTFVIPMTRRVKVRIAQAVKRRVKEDALASGAGLYVCADDDPWARDLQEGLKEIGYEIAMGETYEAALEESDYKPQQLSFVMVGPSLEDEAYAAAARELKLDPSLSMLPIVRGTQDEETAPVRSPRVVPDGEFASVEGAVEMVRDEAERWREEKLYFGRQVTLKSPSDTEAIESLKKLLEGFYKDALADETEAYKTLSAFRECIDNAAAHGNEHSADKFLTVTLMQDDSRLALDVKDEGPGFDYEAILGTSTGSDAASVARERLGRGSSGGLGMRLMHECVDEVRYADGGTRVTLLKRRSTKRKTGRIKRFDDPAST